MLGSLMHAEKPPTHLSPRQPEVLQRLAEGKSMKETATEPSRDAPTAALHGLWRRTIEVSSDVHAISRRLRPSTLEALGLPTTARGYFRDMSWQAVTVPNADRNVPDRIPKTTTLCLFRILEESMSNAPISAGRPAPAAKAVA
jgi:signal transduction histidine kinase